MSNPEIAAAIEKVEALLSVPERWTQEAVARSKDGRTIGPESLYAVCWCIAGALRHAVPDRHFDCVFDFVDRRTPRHSKRRQTLAQFNDRSTHPEVLAFLARCREDALNG